MHLGCSFADYPAKNFYDAPEALKNELFVFKGFSVDNLLWMRKFVLSYLSKIRTTGSYFKSFTN